jgi:uncharacterized membrane protein YdjX (TVP38/TMEM64 family)
MKIKNSENLFRDISTILMITLFFLAASYILSLPSVRESIFDISRWRAYIRKDDGSGALVFLSVLIGVNSLGLPRIWICAIVGALYGAHMGIYIAQGITVIGATINFFAGRWLLRDLIKRRLSERFKVWYDRYSDNGFFWVLNIRLFPLGNATVLSLISGASQMRYLDFLAATFLGYLPLTIIFALFGSSASKNKPLQLIVGACLFMIFMGSRWIYKKYYIKQKKNGVTDGLEK